MALLCLNFMALIPLNAQSTATNITIIPFRMGDKLPDSFWEKEHLIYEKGVTKKQQLAAYRNKLLILDFWASWCGSCLKKFPLADSLQKAYGDQIAIVLVNAGNTRDTKEKIIPVIQRYKLPLPTIYLDSTLTKQFPHAVIPHYIWIEQGQYRAATGTEFFTSEGLAASADRRKYINKLLKKLNEKLK